MGTAEILRICLFAIAALYLIFSLVLLFVDKKIPFKDKILFIFISVLMLGRNIWLIVSSSFYPSTKK